MPEFFVAHRTTKTWNVFLPFVGPDDEVDLVNFDQMFSHIFRRCERSVANRATKDFFVPVKSHGVNVKKGPIFEIFVADRARQPEVKIFHVGGAIRPRHRLVADAAVKPAFVRSSASFCAKWTPTPTTVFL